MTSHIYPVPMNYQMYLENQRKKAPSRLSPRSEPSNCVKMDMNRQSGRKQLRHITMILATISVVLDVTYHIYLLIISCISERFKFRHWWRFRAVYQKLDQDTQPSTWIYDLKFITVPGSCNPQGCRWWWLKNLWILRGGSETHKSSHQKNDWEELRFCYGMRLGQQTRQRELLRTPWKEEHFTCYHRSEVPFICTYF